MILEWIMDQKKKLVMKDILETINKIWIWPVYYIIVYCIDVIVIEFANFIAFI